MSQDDKTEETVEERTLREIQERSPGFTDLSGDLEATRRSIPGDRSGATHGHEDNPELDPPTKDAPAPGLEVAKDAPADKTPTLPPPPPPEPVLATDAATESRFATYVPSAATYAAAGYNPDNYAAFVATRKAEILANPESFPIRETEAEDDLLAVASYPNAAPLDEPTPARSAQDALHDEHDAQFKRLTGKFRGEQAELYARQAREMEALHEKHALLALVDRTHADHEAATRAVAAGEFKLTAKSCIKVNGRELRPGDKLPDGLSPEELRLLHVQDALTLSEVD